MDLEQSSKVENVIRNTGMGILNNIALAALSLVSRKLFLVYIGIGYLSIGQIISNILSILAFSELGVANSVLYMLYKPVAERDEREIARVIGTYKRINRAIGCTLAGLGILCIPFLHCFIRTSVPMDTVYLVYLMNLLSSVSTYFCSYRQVLLNADQKNYVITKISLLINLASISIQCVVICLTHDYILYLAVTMVMGLLKDMVVFYAAGRRYPFLRIFRRERLDEDGARALGNNVKSMFSVKFCGIVINNTDNVLVSMIDTLMVGYCANYTVITQRIRGIISIIHNSIVYSLGIASTEKDSLEKYRLFKKILLINTFLAGSTTAWLGVLWDDLIVLWLGERYLLAPSVLYALLLNYMWVAMTATVWMFRDTNGLFVYVKKMLLINAVSNLGISVILGKIIGVAGVYYGTVIADIATNFWFDARLVYRDLFARKDHWRYMLFILVNMTGVLAAIVLIDHLLSSWQVSVMTWFLKAAVTGMVYTGMFFLLYGKSGTMHEIMSTMVLPRIERWREKRWTS